MFKIKYLGVLGGKRQIKALGGFMIVVFGFSALVLELGVGTQNIEPSWIIWFFRGGIILGIILLIAGVFASDVPSHQL